LDLRFGAYQYRWDTFSNNRFTASGILGADFHLSPYISLYAQSGYALYSFTDSPINSINMTVGLRLNLSEIMSGRTRVQSETMDQRRIFPVSFAWYEDNPVTSLRLINSEPNAVTDVTLSFFMDRYMSQPAQFAVLPRLASGETAEVPVTALFNEVMLSLTENVNAYGQIQVQYRSLGAKKETVMQVQMPIYHRNAMSWDDNRRAASFVSPRDSSARLFARYVASAVDQAADSSLPRNVRYAAALFEALRLYGINYIIDPASSFIELSENASALDSLNYPYQTLFYRGGDCDDLSILFSSLLEVLNIETAFITIPGHIYMAFDSGDEDWLAGSADIIVLNERRWIPVEITVPDGGFTRAWRTGAREWRNAGTEAELFPMHASWEIYPPVSVPGSAGRMPMLPRTSAILQALDSEQRTLSARAGESARR
jgi:hypothetical protein